MPTDLAACEALDRADPLARHRDAFELPAGLVYLDGNSLGALPRATAARVADVIRREWGQDLITSWNKAGWIDLPRRVGDKIGRLVGAAPGEVIVADSTSINVFKVLAAALALRPDRRTILSDSGNFPTDLYMAQGLAALRADGRRLRLEAPEDVAAAIDDDTAVVMLTEVDYRTGRLHDMAAITAAAQARGALMLWDLAHSAGAFPVDLARCNADFAVGCGYKYLNGGPGAPAFVYVAARHQDSFRQPLSGWLGHAAPFAFDTSYAPARGIGRYLCGTPPILSLVALECGVDTLLEADMSAIRAKSERMTALFIDLVERLCAGHGLELASPRAAARRGSQVSFRHPEGYAIMQALIARGVIGDFRAPDILRFGFTPLYLRHVDVWRAADTLRDVLATRAWDAPRFRTRAAVT
ncbi:MAG: kynureninase [Alphaproteobacteria bacterium]|nr:kynureninase [Alphaproteobacteria bacterium]